MENNVKEKLKKEITKDLAWEDSEVKILDVSIKANYTYSACIQYKESKDEFFQQFYTFNYVNGIIEDLQPQLEFPLKFRPGGDSSGESPTEIYEKFKSR